MWSRDHAYSVLLYSPLFLTVLARIVYLTYIFLLLFWAERRSGSPCTIKTYQEMPNLDSEPGQTITSTRVFPLKFPMYVPYLFRDML